jgi:hypothetical protein
MGTQNYSNRLAGVLLFATGILLGTVLFGGLVWSDIEATFYGLPHYTNEAFDGLSCPPLMTHSETASLQATIRNDTDLAINPTVRVDISTPGVAYSDRVKVDLEPGQSKTVEWPVSSENIDLKFFIFARVYRYSDYKTSFAEATCGILVLNIPFINGKGLFALWLGASLICTLAGLWMMKPAQGVPEQRASIPAAMRALTVTMLIGLIFGIQGAWLPGILALVVVVVLSTSIIYLSIPRR